MNQQLQVPMLNHQLQQQISKLTDFVKYTDMKKDQNDQCMFERIDILMARQRATETTVEKLLKLMEENRRLRERGLKYKRLYSESRCRERWGRKVRGPKGQVGSLAITVHGGPENVMEVSSTEEEEEPAKQTTCYKCGKAGHKAYECREATRREALKRLEGLRSRLGKANEVKETVDRESKGTQPIPAARQVARPSQGKPGQPKSGQDVPSQDEPSRPKPDQNEQPKSSKQAAKDEYEELGLSLDTDFSGLDSD